jgi:hypothetical protein
MNTLLLKKNALSFVKMPGRDVRRFIADYQPRPGSAYLVTPAVGGTLEINPGLPFRVRASGQSRRQSPQMDYSTQRTHTARKPLLLFVFVGSLLFRFADRQLTGLLFQEPPRNTRFEPDDDGLTPESE